MIQGLKFKFTSSELKQHMVDRALHHTGRADAKAAELPALREVAEKLKAGKTEAPTEAAGKMSNAMFGGAGDVESAIDTIEREVREHRNKAVAFRLFAEHLFAEDYDLGEADLVRLELLGR